MGVGETSHKEMQGIVQGQDRNNTATKTATSLPNRQAQLLFYLFNRPQQNSGPEIYQALNWSKFAVTRAGSALQARGLVRKIGSRPVFYELTQKGKNLCCGSPILGNVRNLPHRLHGPLTFISRILRKPQNLKQRLEDRSFIPYEPVGGTCYRKRLFNVMIIVTPSTVRFYMPEIYGDEHEVYSDALDLLFQVIGHLEESMPGLRLGNPECTAEISRQEVAKMGDPLAMEYESTGQAMGKRIIYRSDRLAIDKSKGIPELELVHRAHAQDDLRKITGLYEDVIRSDFDLKEFGSSLQEIKALQQGSLQTQHALSNTQNIIAATAKTQSRILDKMNGDIKEIREKAVADASVLENQTRHMYRQTQETSKMMVSFREAVDRLSQALREGIMPSAATERTVRLAPDRVEKSPASEPLALKSVSKQCGLCMEIKEIPANRKICPECEKMLDDRKGPVKRLNASLINYMEI